MAQGYEMVAEQRRAMADLVDGLSPEQLATQSFCGSWTCHEVAAHLLTFTHLPMWKFGLDMAKAAFDYDKAADRIARRFAGEHSASEIASMLRERAAKENISSAFPPDMTVTDVAIHRQDIRRPLGLGTDVDPAVARTVLDFLTTHSKAKAVVAPGRLDGVALRCTDIDWSHGSGQDVSGPAEAIIMAIAGRDTGAELDGDGVERLTARR